jgi:hypothetical protein
MNVSVREMFPNNRFGQWKNEAYTIASVCRAFFFRTRVAYVRFEGFKAVTMKNVVFWNIKSQLILHRKHITSLKLR